MIICRYWSRETIVLNVSCLLLSSICLSLSLPLFRRRHWIIYQINIYISQLWDRRNWKRHHRKQLRMKWDQPSKRNNSANVATIEVPNRKSQHSKPNSILRLKMNCTTSSTSSEWIRFNYLYSIYINVNHIRCCYFWRIGNRNRIEGVAI